MKKYLTRGYYLWTAAYRIPCATVIDYVQLFYTSAFGPWYPRIK